MKMSYDPNDIAADEPRREPVAPDLEQIAKGRNLTEILTVASRGQAFIADEGEEPSATELSADPEQREGDERPPATVGP